MRFVYFILIFFHLNICAQPLKTYSGQYEDVALKNFGDCGIATYTYKGEDKKRIYHGNFTYSDKKKTLKGSFVDDRQEGEWILTEKTYFTVNKNLYTGNRIIKVTYKDGVPCGPFSILLVDGKNNTVKAYIKAQIIEMRLTGKINADMNSNLFDFSGENFSSSYDIPYLNNMNGEFDDKGMPKGNWVVFSSTCEITEEYSRDRKFNVKTYNPSTGDIIDDERKPYMPNMVVEAANFAFRKTRLRSSEHIQLDHFEFIDSVKSEAYRKKVAKRIGSMFKSKSKN